MLRVDIKSDLAKHLDRVSKIPTQLIKDTYNYFVSKTPERTGNAKRSTKLTNNRSIDMNYPYATKLEEGYSKQAPEGMIKPTEEYLTKRMDELINKNKD